MSATPWPVDGGAIPPALACSLHGLAGPTSRRSATEHVRLTIADGHATIAKRAIADPFTRLAKALGLPGTGLGPTPVAGLGAPSSAPVRLATLAGRLVATTRRGQPTLFDRLSLAAIGLLGRRREWRGAAGSRDPFIDAEVTLGSGRAPSWLVSRTDEGVDLIRASAAGLERWQLELGEVGELGVHACRDGAREPQRIALTTLDPTRTTGHVAIFDLRALPPGQRPLVDPRPIALRPELQTLADTQRFVRFDGDGLWLIQGQPPSLVCRPLGERDRLAPPRATIALPGQPIEWIADRWLFTRTATTLLAIELAPGGRVHAVDAAPNLLATAGPWLWTRDADSLQLWDATTLEAGPTCRWPDPFDGPTAAVVCDEPAGLAWPWLDEEDALPELTPLRPELEGAWRRCFPGSRRGD